MCNYCGCRAIATVAELTAEHEQLQRTADQLGRACDRGDLDRAAAELRALVELLGPHDQVEELALYPALLREAELAERVGSMFDEHDEIDEVLRRAVAVAAVEPAEVEWSGVRAALEKLVRHIDAEEYGLFPAAAVALDPAAWEHAEAVRAAIRTR